MYSSSKLSRPQPPNTLRKTPNTGQRFLDDGPSLESTENPVSGGAVVNLQNFSTELLRNVDHQTTEVYENISRMQEDLKAMKDAFIYIKGTLRDAHRTQQEFSEGFFALMEVVRAEINTLSATFIERNKDKPSEEDDTDTQRLEKFVHIFHDVEERLKSTLIEHAALRYKLTHDAEIQTKEPSSEALAIKGTPALRHTLTHDAEIQTTEPSSEALAIKGTPAHRTPSPEQGPAAVDDLGCLFSELPPPPVHLDQTRDSLSSFDPSHLPGISLHSLQTSERSYHEIMSVLLGYVQAFCAIITDAPTALHSLVKKHTAPSLDNATRFLLSSLLVFTVVVSVHLSRNSDAVEGDHPVWTALQKSGGPAYAYEMFDSKQ